MGRPRQRPGQLARPAPDPEFLPGDHDDGVRELMRWICIRAEPLPTARWAWRCRPGAARRAPVERPQRATSCSGLAVIVVVLTSSLLRSQFGRAFMAIRDNELAAAAVEYRPTVCFVLALAWSGSWSAWGAPCTRRWWGHVTPEAFNLLELILHFAVVMVGGLASLAGSVIGRRSCSPRRPELFRSFPGDAGTGAGALLIIVVLLILPRGLVSLLDRGLSLFRERCCREWRWRSSMLGWAHRALRRAHCGRGGLVPRRARRGAGHHRAERRRQDVAVQCGDRARAAERGGDHLPRRAGSTAWPRTWCRRRASAGHSRTGDLRRADRAGERAGWSSHGGAKPASSASYSGCGGPGRWSGRPRPVPASCWT